MVYVAKDNQDEGTIHDGTRVCRKCGERKPMQKFYFANGKKNRRRKCAQCTDEERKQRWADNPETKEAFNNTVTNSYLKLKYGITLGERDGMLMAQEGRCAICPTPVVTGRGVINSKAHVDHDHATGKVRGILCFTCNTALGKFNDDIALLESAIDYLRRNA